MKRFVVVSVALLVFALLVAAFSVKGGPDKDEWIAKCAKDQAMLYKAAGGTLDYVSVYGVSLDVCEQDWNKHHPS